MSEVIFSATIGAVSAIVALYIFSKYYIEGFLNQYLNQYLYSIVEDPDNKKAVDSYVELITDKIQKRIMGSFGGMASGMSKQLGKLEEDLQTDAVTAQVGNPIAAAAIMKYARKYPILGAILPTILANPNLLQNLGKKENINTGKTSIPDELYK